MGEKLGLAVSKLVTKIPGLRKYKPIRGFTVAEAMIRTAQNTTSRPKYTIFTFDEIFELVV
jgi:hypothetical protein